MTCPRNYEIVIREPLGDLVLFVRNEYLCRWALNENQVGTCILELPADVCERAGFTLDTAGEDYRIEIWREVNGVRSLVGLAPFFIQLISARQNADGGEVFYIEAESATGLLKRRINAYESDEARSELAPLPADDQIKFVARNNFTAIAGDYINDPEPLRDLSSQLIIEADVSAIVAQFEGKVANKTVLDIANQCADYAFQQNEPLFFIVEQTANIGAPFLTLRTFAGIRGVDRTTTTGGANARTITPENGTISEYDLAFNFKDTVNRMFAGGRGQGGGRDYGYSEDVTLVGRLVDNPFAVREGFANVPSETPNGVQVETDAALRGKLSGVSLSGTASENQAFVYGADFLWGDRITAVVRGFFVDVFIDTEDVTLQDGREDLKVGFSTNLNRKRTELAGLVQQFKQLQRDFRLSQTIETP